MIRNPTFGSDLPKLDEPLPKFLDDDAAAAFMQAATRLDPLRRLVAEMLARTGMRVGELCALPSDYSLRYSDTRAGTRSVLRSPCRGADGVGRRPWGASRPGPRVARP